MKLQHLEYVIAIAQEGSITAAAKRLFQAQPNISIALKELESSIGTQIFWRTPNGMVLTPEGEEFLARAKKIVEDMHSLEADYSNRNSDSMKLRITAAHSTYVSSAVGIWINMVGHEREKIDVRMNEFNTNRVVEDISSGKADIGIMRIPVSQYEFYEEQLSSRKLSYHKAVEFNMQLLMRKDHPLAVYDDVPYDELHNYVEIIHGDDELNVFGRTYINPDHQENDEHKCVHVFDRGSKTALMNTIDGAYMWIAPIPKEASLGNLVVKKCSYASVKLIDLVICKKNLENNPYVKEFRDFLMDFTKKMFPD